MSAAASYHQPLKREHNSITSSEQTEEVSSFKQALLLHSHQTSI